MLFSDTVLQVWSSSYLPNEAEVKDRQLFTYQAKHGRNLLIDYAQKEISKQVTSPSGCHR